MRFTALALFLCCASASANIIYVSPTGSTAGDGTVSAPYDSVFRGISEASAGDTVILEDGTYHEHGMSMDDTPLTLGSRFVLDGNTAHTDACIIDGDSTSDVNGSLFLFGQVAGTVRMAGLTFRNGTGTGSGPRKSGGAFLMPLSDTSVVVGPEPPLVLEQCVIRDNHISGFGGAVNGGVIKFRYCRITGNSAYYGGGLAEGIHDIRYCVIDNNRAEEGGGMGANQVTMVYCTIAGNNATNASNTNGFCASWGSFTNCVIADQCWVETPYSKIHLYYCLYSHTFPSEALESDCTGNLAGVDPKLTSTAAGDVHLLANSPAVDAGHPDSSYVNEPDCSGSNARVNIGRYGNTAEATCAANNAVLAAVPAAMVRTFYQHEIRWDTLTVSNAGTDPMRLDAVKTFDQELVFLSWGTNLLDPGATTPVALRGTFETVRADTVGVQVISNAGNGSVTVPYRINVKPTTGLDALFMPRGYEFGSAKLNETAQKTFHLRNNGSNGIRIDDIRLSDTTYFQLGSGVSGPLDGGDSASFTLRFNPPSAITYAVKLLVTSPNYSITDTILIQGIGADIDDPVAVIDSSLPDSVVWGGTIDFIDGGSTDMDEVGPQSPVRYVWTCGADTIGTQANINNYPADSFAIGRNIVTLVVMDNENTWSAPASDTFHLKGLPPAVDSIVCNTGLILSTHPADTLTAFASDRDEFATRNVNNGDLTAIEWYSCIDGLLGTGMMYVMNPGVLSLGTHGFVCKVTDDEGDVAYSDTLWVPVQTAIGRAVLVAGTAFDDYQYFYNNINPNVNWAYKKLKDRGFTDEQIYYMNPVGWQSIDDPYADAGIVDETQLTKDNLHAHLTGLKSDIQNNVPLVLAFIGHGNAADQDGKFYLNATEYLTPDDLGGWLDEYEDLDMEHSQITVILDFCYSGTFFSRLRTMYDQNRYIVSASDDENAAYFVDGKSFSWNIFNQVYRGKSLKRAYDAAKSWSDANAPGSNPANPRLNSNGNSATNEDIDFSLADKVYIGGSQELQAVVPGIDTAFGIPHVSGDITDSVTLEVRTDGEVTSLWARVVGPGFVMGASEIQDQPVVAFADAGGGVWRANDVRPFAVGDYLYLVEGADAAGNGLLGAGVAVSIGYPGGVTPVPVPPDGFRGVSVLSVPGSGRVVFRVGTSYAGSEITVVRGDGRQAAVIQAGTAGAYAWDGTDDDGRRWGDAVYYYRVDGPAGTVTGRFLLVR